MIRDITLGQYYPVDSVLHRMDPRTKLFGTLVFIVSLFCKQHCLLCGGNSVSDYGHSYVEGAVFLHGKGIKGNRISAADQCELQPVSDTGNAGGSVWHF